MAEDHRARGLPPRDPREESQYPPLPGDEDERSRYPQLPAPPMAAGGVTLPSINDHYAANSSRYPPPDPRADPRSRGNYSASPTSVNGYGPPSSSSGGHGYLPPVQSLQEGRSSYGNEGREYYGGPSQRHSYGADGYAGYNGYRPGPPPSGGYGYVSEFRQVQPQAAPRQRTSIACRYCRKRKIRCSGYQQTPDGKCTNCKKTGNECVFQPVSSSSSTAFIPVSAVPGGVPPGTPLYGAFGQPLAPATGPGGAGPPAPYAPASAPEYPLPSPTSSSGYYSHPDERVQPGSRRPRPQDDEQAMRLPPPHPYYEEDARRRSPVSMQSNTPPTGYHQYPPRGGEYEPDRTPTPRKHSPGGGSTASGGTANVMSLGNLMDQPSQPPRDRDIDRNMLGRLNRPPPRG